MSSPATYRIALPQFEGPFDLLLFFIERDELDIGDIPIAKLAADFLAYIRTMEAANIDLAGEFMAVAATLMRIKAKLLLPRPERTETGEELDPRAELAERLMAYKTFKAAAEDLKALEAAHAERLARAYAAAEARAFSQDDSPEAALQHLDLYALMRTFERLWQRHQGQARRPVHVIRPYPYTVEGVKGDILARLASGGPCDVVGLLCATGERIYAIFCLLALLELAQARRVRLHVGQGHNQCLLSPGVA